MFLTSPEAVLLVGGRGLLFKPNAPADLASSIALPPASKTVPLAFKTGPPTLEEGLELKFSKPVLYISVSSVLDAPELLSLCFPGLPTPSSLRLAAVKALLRL